MKFFLVVLFLVLLLPFTAFAQSPAGSWTGPFKSTGPSGSLDLTVSNAETLTGETGIRFGGRAAKGTIKDAKITGQAITFSSDLADAKANFTGTVGTDKIIGTFEVVEGGRRTLAGAFCLAKAGATACAETDIPPVPNIKIATQRADDDYDTSVKSPAYAKAGPKVLFDEAHNNFHKTTTNFKPFASLIRNDGYVLTPNPSPFSDAVLKGYDVLIISNARGERDASAFTDAEIDAVDKWVKAGGALLLVADHTPFGGYAENLANRFGVDMSKGYTDDPPNKDPIARDLLFSRDNGLLSSDHAITNGRNATERVNRVVSFTGQSKSAIGTVILKLAGTAYDQFPGSDKKIPAAGRSQAIVMSHGKGKVFVSGEAAMFTAQITPEDRRFGMNVPGLDNRQYVLNVVHWLSGLLK